MDGFAEYVEVETPRLLGLGYALTGNPHDAWDLTQEALTRVGLRWRRLADENPGGYARTTLVRLHLRHARRRSREVVVDEPVEREAPLVVEQSVSPWLLEALAHLTPQQRAAVVLRTIEDLDHAAIAERLGCSAGTARTHLSRGLATMRERAAARTEVE